MRLINKKILSFIVLLFVAIACTSCEPKKETIKNEVEASEELQIVKSDFTLTQDQVLSQIKAQHIKENNGYVDSDEIIALIALKDEALIDDYNEKYSSNFDSIVDYSKSALGLAKKDTLVESQNKLISKLKSLGLINNVEYTYTTIINAISVKTTYGNFKKISKLSDVEYTVINDTYNKPLESTDETSAIENLVDVYETGIFNSSKVPYTGEGTAVAILDSGFDCSHSVFRNQPSNLLISQQDITAVLENTNAKATSQNLELSDVYYSKKIPFVYDYADKDPNVFPYDSEHGTHVAGIIGGKDDTITGIAVNTQLVLLKVFPDLDSGADTDDILAALEDAVLLGVDAINMSLGSSCGFAREEDGNKINDVYDKINESGISLITAASNSYSSGFGGAQGNTNMVTNPDSGTVGAPSTYAASLSVASISGTKSRYILGNDSQIFFFKESNAITGDENNFIKELGITEGVTKTYDYVTIPGVGLKVNYNTVGDLTGKIALVRRGSNTFEEKALNAKNAGAVACIIYNNIDGDITMSMGKTDHIPTISISKDDGTELAKRDTGKLTISYKYQAGPFMSDFSSWGPTPSLGMKPEITAHGGNILSSVPGGGYDELSGTSMACPNLCGIVVLIRQYLKEKYPAMTTKEISVLTNQLLMSTATIIRNQDGNPYSPRKQGAGLASLTNAVTTKAYLTVDGIDRPKLELLDDPQRTGVYTMNFNVVNISDSDLIYNLETIGMTESVSTSDKEHVSEKSQILSGDFTAEVIKGGSIKNNVVTVSKNSTCKIKVVYKLTESDKNLIDSLFPYGMFVEGFVKLVSQTSEEIDLNIPFLAFYGDWTEAPMFDKTYYEVESEAHDPAIDEEDKIKADYVATTPYGSYYYNYIIPLGTYLYDVDTENYDEIPADIDKISISNILGTIDGISTVYTGLLRNAKTMTYTITDKITGEVVYEHIDYNANKAYSYGGSPYPYTEDLRIKSAALELINNRQYEFRMSALLDYKDGGESTNKRNSFSFDFYLDDEAPILESASYEKVYDKNLKKDRYYITMNVSDNQYVQSITPIIFTSSSSYDFLSENPIPVYGEKGETTAVRFEITDYLEDIYSDTMITSALAFSIDDYALNSNIYFCQLPGTKGDFKFTKDGTMEGTDLVILSMYEDEILDLTDYLATADETVDEEKDYLKYLSWQSSNENVATVKEGIIKGNKAGKATITVRESMDLKQAILIINVKARETEEKGRANPQTPKLRSYEDETIDSIRFAYFDTLFAYSRAAQTSEIGATGNRIYISSLSSLSFYPGEKIQLSYDFDPWYLEDKYELTYSSTNPSVASVDENGVVTGLKEGTTNIVLKVSGSTLMARLKITIKSEFVIEDRTLIAYKGLGGDVVIPDDEGILYIGAYAFCLYDTDRTIELTEEDYDANKIPSMNTSVKSVTIPYGVEEIRKYAFYNCSGLEKVILPTSTKFIREYAFCKDEKLSEINLENVEVIGREAFYNCNSLTEVDFSKMYALGVSAFEKCSGLKTVDLTNLRNSGQRTFKDCTSLESVTLNEHTKLSYAMFVNSGLTSVDIYETVAVPEFCFAQSKKLKTVNIHNDLVELGKGAFSECLALDEFNIHGVVESFGEQLFYASTALKKIVLPNNEMSLGAHCFYMCSELETVEFQENTYINEIYGVLFKDTKLTNFIVNINNQHYATLDNLLTSKDGKTIILAAINNDFGDFVLDDKYNHIASGAFSGANITSLTINNKNVVIDDYAFANCDKLTTVTFANEIGNEVGRYAFTANASLETVNNLDKVLKVGDYAFSSTGIKNVKTGDNAVFGEGAFFRSKVVTATLGESSTYGMGAFQSCTSLKVVNMPEGGNVHFGNACFGYDLLLERIDLSKVDSIIEKETFYGCSSLKVATLDNVKEIGEYAFADCSSLNHVTLPIIEKIGSGAFSRYDTNGGAPVFNEIILPNTLVEIEDGAFLGCEGLEEITLPSSITKCGNYLFAYCKNLIKVVLPDNMTRVGEYSFAGCESLININLENVTEISDYAFTSSVSLATIDLSNIQTIGDGSFASTMVSGSITAPHLVSVGSYAFQGTNITAFNAENLKSIGIASFQNNSNLTEFVFSKDLENISPIAFLGCKKLASFYYQDGSEKKNDGEINDYALLDNGILYTKLKNNNYQLTSVPSDLNIDTLVVLDNTYRIDLYAGNENEHIIKIVCPDTLKTIGNYAFYNYKNLSTVEFKSFTAPALEDSYNSNTELLETDPGYSIIHAHFDLFGEELYYYTFIDLVGKKEPISMILPVNEGIKGYDSIVYRVYFGKVEDSQRSDYEAMDKSLIEFIDYANDISKIKTVSLTDEKLINNAITCYNSIKQDITKYGFTTEEWEEMVTIVQNAKAELVALKIASASQEVQNVQKEIDNLPDSFDISKFNMLKDLMVKINALTIQDKSLLDLTKYNILVSSYNEYVNSVNNEAVMINNPINSIVSLINITTIGTISLVGVWFIIVRKRIFI